MDTSGGEEVISGFVVSAQISLISLFIHIHYRAKVF